LETPNFSVTFLSRENGGEKLPYNRVCVHLRIGNEILILPATKIQTFRGDDLQGHNSTSRSGRIDYFVFGLSMRSAKGKPNKKSAPVMTGRPDGLVMQLIRWCCGRV
jgi:hypothetical protein